MIIERIEELRTLIADAPESACDMRPVLEDSRRAPCGKAHRTTTELVEEFRVIRFECGAVGCFAGWTLMLMPAEMFIEFYDGRKCETRMSVAAKYLDLTRQESALLFEHFPDIAQGLPMRFGWTWKRWMLWRLDRIIRSGVIDDNVHGYRDESVEASPVEELALA